ncbi:MAG: hypothetical protein CMB56_002420 [Methanobacteriota archaeon]|nr:MAG: hypothetical protein CMB56_002420 [Euryarchaeota archaeon]
MAIIIWTRILTKKRRYTMDYAEKEIEKIKSKSKIVNWISPLDNEISFTIPHTVYPPREDTYLLAETIRNLGQGNSRQLLEIGCGSGVVSLFASNLGWNVVGCDINPLAVATSRGLAKQLKNRDVKFIEGGIEPQNTSDSNVFNEGPFDLIVWNLPYLKKPKKDEFLGPMEEASLSDIGDLKTKKIHQLLLDKIEKFDALKHNGLIILIHSDEDEGKFITTECRKMGWATREINHKYFENGEKIISSAIWKPWANGKFISLDTVNSTNSFLLEGSFPVGTLVTTQNQTEGRGQRRNKWKHFEGGWCGSWKISMGESSPAVIQAKAALAVIEAIAIIKSIPLPTFDLVSMSNFLKSGISVKWPNDILMHNKKFCGILCEARTQGKVTNCVVGIGCNISDNKGEIASNNDYIATSLSALGEINVAEWTQVLNASISSQLEKHELVKLNNEPEVITSWWQSMVNFNRNHKLLINGVEHRVCCLNSDGSLELINSGYEAKSIINLRDCVDCEWVEIHTKSS